MLPIQQFSSGVLAEIIRRQPPCAERTAFAWQVAVGPAISRTTTIELVDGVLLVAARDPHWAHAVEQATQTILARMHHLLGPQAIKAVKVLKPR